MLRIYYQEWDKSVCIIYKNKILAKQTTVLVSMREFKCVLCCFLVYQRRKVEAVFSFVAK